MQRLRAIFFGCDRPKSKKRALQLRLLLTIRTLPKRVYLRKKNNRAKSYRKVCKNLSIYEKCMHTHTHSHTHINIYLYIINPHNIFLCEPLHWFLRSKTREKMRWWVLLVVYCCMFPYDSLLFRWLLCSFMLTCLLKIFKCSHTPFPSQTY